MPSLTVALLLLEWLHDGVYAGRSVCMYVCVNVGKVVKKGRPFLTTLPTLTHTYIHTLRPA